MCRDDVSSPFVEGSRLQRLRESIGPLFIRGHKYQADAPVVVFMPDVVHRVAEMFVARCYTWILANGDGCSVIHCQAQAAP